MTRRLIPALAILSAMLVLSHKSPAVERKGDDDRKRYEYTCKEGNYKAIFPSKPQTREERFGDLSVYFAYVETRGGAYFVAHTDKIPELTQENDAQIERRFDGAREGMLRMVNARLVKEEKILFEKKYKGREVVGELGGDKAVFNLIVRNKIYIINGRMYQVMVLGTKNFIASPDAQAFVSSFWTTSK